MKSPLEIRRHGSATSFLRRAEKWLLAREAENNLLLGIAYRLSTSTAGFDPPIYLTTIERGEDVVGCAFRTPPHKLGLTSLPMAAVEPLVRDVAAIYEELPAVLGPEPEVSAFARRWSELQGISTNGGMEQRLYTVETVQPLPWKVPGTMHEASYADLELIADWIGGFTRETGIPTQWPREMAELLVDLGALFFWDDGGPKAMAGTQGETANGIRISYVYTPDENRRRGYASSLVRELSRSQLHAGKKFCLLYADLTNPTSNSIYRRIGYRPLCDVRDYHFM